MDPPPLLDWIHPPAGAVPLGLSAPLHDGEVMRLTSDALARTVTLEVDVPHVRAHHGLAPDVRFVLRLDGVTSMRAATWYPWPMPAPPYRGGEHVAEDRRLADEHRAKGREASIAWGEFEAIAARDRLNVLDAEVLLADSVVALRFETLARRDSSWYVAHVRAGSLAIARSDGVALTLEELGELGAAYWRAWEARNAPTR